MKHRIATFPVSLLFVFTNEKNPLLEFCRALRHATEDIKWKKDLVFSVGGKMFAVFNLDDITQFSFKTTPAMFGTLTAIDGIVPAPYGARYNWVLVTNPQALPQKMLKGLLAESHQLVAVGLPANVRKELGLEVLRKKSRKATVKFYSWVHLSVGNPQNFLKFF